MTLSTIDIARYTLDAGVPAGLMTFVDAPESAGIFDELVLARADLWWAYVAVAVVVCAYVWGARARRRSLESLGPHHLVARLVSTVNPGVRTLQAVLVCLAVTCVATGLMRIQYGGIARVVKSSGLDVVVAVDYSKSMLAEDVYPNRSERLEAELARFLDDSGQRGDRVGVVVFAGAARGVPLTSDMRLLRLFLEKADPRTENPGGTSLGKALDLALEFLVDARRSGTALTDEGAGEAGKATPELAPDEADQIIILLTDGEDTVSRPAEVAERAAKLGVRIYSVGIGSQSGEPIAKFDFESGKKIGYQRDEDGNYVMTRLDEATLQGLAERTGGRYVHVEAESFGLDRIRAMMAELSRAKREDTVEIHREEGFAFVLVPALLCLCLALAVSDRKKAQGEVTSS